jgi:hypothetical protein
MTLDEGADGEAKAEFPEPVARFHVADFPSDNVRELNDNSDFVVIDSLGPGG